MLNLMQFEQYRDLYANYLNLKPNHKTVDFTYKVGDENVTIRTDKRDYREVTAWN